MKTANASKFSKNAWLNAVVKQFVQMSHPEWSAVKRVVEGSLVSLVFLLAACGGDGTTENITQINQMGMDVVASVDDLPKCEKSNEGEQALVKGESSVRVCVDGKWFATASNGGDMPDFSCSTKELKDKSGLKIICNGDSIGVVLNGSKGADGKQGIQGEKGTDGTNGTNGKNGDDGAGCVVTEQTDSYVNIKCGDKNLTLNLGEGDGAVSVDTSGLDSEKVAVSLDTLSGVSQKGPFLKGSTVFLYELSDGRTLKQTNGNFVSEIMSDDGRFGFTARNLMSQYALIMVDGKYRNEVTGDPTTTTIRLQAYTDVLSRKKANVNLLTHLEKNRVYYLVTQAKKRFKVAKHMAQMEILDAFYIDTTGINKSSEDLNVFGSSDADAALLAISILLQRDSSETELSVLLTGMASDMEKDGLWNDSAKRAEIAEWAATMDSSFSVSESKLDEFRSHVEGWGLGDGNVPDFEKYIRKFWSKELGLGVCDDKDNPIGTVKNVSNPKAFKYYASSYFDAKNKVRFICDDASLSRWRAATDVEKDTYQWEAGEDGQIKTGDVTKTQKYDYDGVLKAWRDATPQEAVFGGCTEALEADLTHNIGNYEGSWYICKNRWWTWIDGITADTLNWGQSKDGDLKKGDHTNTFYKYDVALGAWVTATQNDTTLELRGCTSKRTGEIDQSPTNDIYYVCKNMDWQEALEIDYDTYGEMCSADSVGKIVSGVVTVTNKYYCTANGWVSLMGGWSWDIPKEARLNPEKAYGTMTDSRDHKVYKTIQIGDQVWMAENLNYADSNKTPSLLKRSWCYNDNAENCAVAGRLYTWAAAIDSVKLATDADNPQDCGLGKTCTLPAKVQGICPPGWHLPTETEWETLFTAVGELSTAGKILKSQSGWNSNGNGTDALGFSALPAGIRQDDGSFFDVGKEVYFWSLTESSNDHAFNMYLFNDVDNVNWYNNNKGYGYSVRCVQD